MEDHDKVHIKLEGELVADLLDQVEFPSNVGSVAAVSKEQICFLRRTHHELVPYEMEYFDVHDCKAIDYRKDTAYYRIFGGIAFFALAVLMAYLLITDPEGFSAESSPLVLAFIGLVVFGIRFITSIHRHVMHFEMPDEILTWRSPAIDFDSKAEAAHAVRDYARERGILKSVEK